MSIFKLSTSQLEARIRRVATDPSRVILTDHARTQMRKRHLPIDVVVEVLRQGRIRRTPEPNHAKASIECRMERFVAGVRIGVVAAVSDHIPT